MHSYYPEALKEALKEETRLYFLKNSLPFDEKRIRIPNFSFSESSEKWGATAIEKVVFWQRVIWQEDFPYFLEKLKKCEEKELIIDNVKYII